MGVEFNSGKSLGKIRICNSLIWEKVIYESIKADLNTVNIEVVLDNQTS